MNLLIKKTEDAKDLNLPEYQTIGAAGFDLLANVTEEIIIKPNQCAFISAGICMEIPRGFEGQVRGRSGNAFKDKVAVLQDGTIDCDYRGEIKVALKNHGDKDFVVKRGDRIAQMIIAKVEHPTIIEVDELSETIRGEGGFGSTGK